MTYAMSLRRPAVRVSVSSPPFAVMNRYERTGSGLVRPGGEDATK